MKSGIYQILNLINGKFYIGSAVSLSHRWKTHLWHFNRGSHHNKHMQSAFNLYGEEAFKFIVLEYCEKDKLNIKEQFYIDWFDACKLGYNKRSMASNNLGIVRSEETKQKQRLAMTGLKHSEYTLEKMRLIQSSRSEETKKKLSASKMGHFVSEQTKMKIGLSNKIKNLIKREIPIMLQDQSWIKLYV